MTSQLPLIQTGCRLTTLIQAEVGDLTEQARPPLRRELTSGVGQARGDRTSHPIQNWWFGARHLHAEG
jgi:hypothetical protein